MRKLLASMYVAGCVGSLIYLTIFHLSSLVVAIWIVIWACLLGVSLAELMG